jgi:hypothetical protein
MAAIIFIIPKNDKRGFSMYANYNIKMLSKSIDI